MASTHLELPRSYTSRAFRDQHNLIVLGGCIAFSFAFWSPIPALVGVAGECLWLLFAPRVRAFREFVDGFDESDARLERERRFAVEAAALSPSSQQRLLALAPTLDGILDGVAAQAKASAFEKAAAGRTLGEVRRRFLAYALLSGRVASAVEEIPLSALVDEIERLRAAATAERNLETRVGLRRSLSLAERRHAQREQLVQIGRAVDQRLENAEKSVAYLGSRAAQMRSLAELEREAASLLGYIGVVSELESSLTQLLGGTVQAATLSPRA
jgi:hypothetical protein